MTPESLGTLHLLSVVTWLPLAGALLLALVPGARTRAVKWFAIAWMGLSLVASLPLLLYDRGAGGMQFVEDAAWIPLLGARYSLGVDGVSVALVLLTSLLGVVATAASWRAVATREKEFYGFMLAMQTALVGAFCSLDLLLFFAFSEATLVPMFFLVGIWGGDRRLYAATKAVLFALAGSGAMLLAVLKLYALTTDAATLANIASVQATAKTVAGSSAAAQGLVDAAISSMRSGSGTFNVLALQAVGGAKLLTGASLVPLAVQVWIFAGLFAGLAVRVPIFPLHAWLPDAVAEAPTAASVILAGVALKLGGYGFVRFVLPMAPDACRDPAVRGVVVGLAVTGIVYGALCAMYYVVTSGDLKRLVAYASVSHMGVVVLGLFALNPSGIGGAVLQMINAGIATAALAVVVGALAERRGSRLVSDLGGLAGRAPALAAAVFVAALSSIGMPLLGGFVGMFLVLRGAFEANPWWAGAAAAGLVLGAAYTIWLVQRLAFGPVEPDEGRALGDLDLRERACLLPLVALAVWIGVYPKPALELIERPAHLLAYQIWHQPGVEDRYAPTPEEQERLVRQRAGRAAAGEAEAP